jgi:hypothetical protein
MTTQTIAETIPMRIRPHNSDRGNFTANARYFAGHNTPGNRSAITATPIIVEIIANRVIIRE